MLMMMGLRPVDDDVAVEWETEERNSLEKRDKKKSSRERRRYALVEVGMPHSCRDGTSTETDDLETTSSARSCANSA